MSSTNSVTNSRPLACIASGPPGKKNSFFRRFFFESHWPRLFFYNPHPPAAKNQKDFSWEKRKVADAIDEQFSVEKDHPAYMQREILL